MLINDPNHWRLRIPRNISESGAPRWLSKIFFKLIVPKENQDELEHHAKEFVKHFIANEKVAKEMMAKYPEVGNRVTIGALTKLPGGISLLGNAMVNFNNVYGEEKLEPFFVKFISSDAMLDACVKHFVNIFAYFQETGYYDMQTGTISPELNDPDAQEAVEQMLAKKLAEVLISVAPEIWVGRAYTEIRATL